MWEYLGLVLATLILALYLVMTLTERRNSDYWTKLGFPIITNKISLFDLMTGRKSSADADIQHYQSLGDTKYGGVMEFGSPILLVKDLDLARDIFIKDFDHFVDRRDAPNVDPLFTKALVFMKGAAWKEVRNFLSPTFTSGRIRRMFPHFGKSAQNLQSYINSHPTSKNGGIEIHLNEVVRKFTVDVISATAFGMNSDVFSNPNSEFFAMAERMGNMPLIRKIRIAIFQSFPKMAELLNISFIDGEASTYFQQFLTSVFQSREKSVSQKGIKRDDFLQLITEAMSKGGGGLRIDESELTKEEKEAQLVPGKNNFILSQDLAISQSFVFLLAGFDAVANNLAVTVQQLASHPELQEKVSQEVDDICGAGKEITYEDVNAMEHLDNFVSETLRLYPAASRIERKCVMDYPIELSMDYPIPGTKHVIPVGTIVAIPAEAIHRDEKYWPNPLEFDPDRFTPEVKATRNSYAYMPFGIGPRNCIGMRFALVETKVALANIVKNFKIVPTEVTLGPVREVFGYRVPSDSKIRFIPRN